MIIISFIPPYYPKKELNNNKLIKNLERTIKYGELNFNVSIKKSKYFMGICDLSYTGSIDGEKLNSIYNNIPFGEKYYNFPIEDLKKLDIPGIIFGPYGKDLHKNTERINIPYSFEVLPKLYEYLIYDIFTD
ncbi:MAG: hypothetical protein FH753_05410 [Firmicutes bacterium]|nr:hypothetical protein [Bacillota bacterium]